MDRLLRLTREFELWLREQALPLWAGTGFSKEYKASYERLLADGRPDIQIGVRLRVQARQAFVYAMAHDLGWSKEGQSRAQVLLNFMNGKSSHPTAENGYAHLLNKDFNVIDDRKDLYDHAFFILANIWCYHALGDNSALKKARSLVKYLDRQFGSSYGGWIEGDYDFSFRRQNPHMHMFEAFLAAYDATEDSYWLIRAEEVFGLFEKHFYSHKESVIFEYFNGDWSPAEGAGGGIVEPGHMMEWVWLLRWYSDRSGEDVSRYADSLYCKAIEIGVCPESGLLYDEVSAYGEPIKPTKRCWPMTEYIKASIAQAAAGKDKCVDVAANAIELLIQYYIDPALTDGAYIDQRGKHNEILVDVAPASTLYHLMVSCVEATKFCGVREAQKKTMTFSNLEESIVIGQGVGY